jgi:F-type H+-transporting ATPase subunit b
MLRLNRLLAASAFSAAALWAQESENAKPDMTLWQWLNFAILAWVLVWLFRKYGAPALRERSQQIETDLAAGQKAKAEADARAAEVEARLAGLEKEIRAMRSNAAAERDREADRIRSESKQEIARIQKQSALELESLGKNALLEVQHAAARLALELAEEKLRARMSPDLQTTLIDGFLKDLPGGNSRSQSNAG